MTDDVDAPEPEAEYDLPVTTDTPADVPSGSDESAYNPTEDDPSADHSPTEE